MTMPDHIGRYEILERIAIGRQGTIYRARDTVLDRTVAVKLINQPIAADQPYLDALQREARLAARLEHSNITSVYDFQVEDGQLFIVMEYVPDSLDKHMSGGKKLPHRRALEIAVQVCRALSHAHKAGIIHRDIKPQHILLTQDGSAKVSDFGIARALASSTATRATDVLGTPPYMAVEQWSGNHVDGRTDLYSLAVLLYEMLTGERPYRGETFGELYVQHLEHPAPPVPAGLGPIAGPVEMVLHRAMEKRPEDRFNNADEMAAALEDVLAGRPVETSTSVGPDTKRRLPLADKLARTPLTKKISTALYIAAAVAAIASAVAGLAAAGVLSTSNRPPLSAASNSVVITPSEAARLFSEDGNVIVELEPQTVDTSSTLSYRSLAPSEVPDLPTNFSATGRAFDLTLDSPLMQPITVTVALSDAGITQAGGDKDKIVILHYSGGAWNQLDTSVDIGASTAAALVDRLSIFAVTVRGTDTAPASPVPTQATPLPTTITLPGLTTALPTVDPSAAPPNTSTLVPTATSVPTPTPTPASKPTPVPPPTPATVPTPTAVPTPTPTPEPAYSLRINGNLVPAGQTTVPVLNGTVTLSDGPRADGRYAAGQVVTLVANPITARSQMFWGGVDNQNGSLATVRMGAERFVTLIIVVTPPTATPSPAPTPTPVAAPVPGHLTVSVTGDRLSFNTSYFTAAAGEVVTMTLNNVSTINSHNWVLVEAGYTNAVASAGALWPLNDWIPPEDPRVIASTRLLLPGETGQVVFTTPEAGIYQFVCTFPGHNPTMFGAFVVTAP